MMRVLNRVVTQVSRCHQVMLPGMVCCCFTFFIAPQSYSDEPELLAETEYRSELEEVVVVGKTPAWRQKVPESEWRPDRFKLAKTIRAPRLQWLPEYTKEDRDNYDGVRDRKGEKPEFQIFKWKF